MRREYLYLRDIIEACEMIETFLKGMDVEQFLTSELHKAAVLQKLILIGEAASRLSHEFCEKHSQIEWRDIVAFRNIAVHAYFAVQWDIVWATVVDDVPMLRRQILNVLDSQEINLPEQ